MIVIRKLLAFDNFRDSETYLENLLLSDKMSVFWVVRPVGVIEGEFVLRSSFSQCISFPALLFGDGV